MNRADIDACTLVRAGVLALRFTEETRDFVESKLLPHLIKERKLHDCPPPLLMIAASHAEVIVSSGAMDEDLLEIAVRMLPLVVRASAWGSLDRTHYADAAVSGGVELVRLLLQRSTETAPLLLEALIGLAEHQDRDTQAEGSAPEVSAAAVADEEACESGRGVAPEFAQLMSRRSRAERRADMDSLASRLIHLLPPPPPPSATAPSPADGESVETIIHCDDDGVARWRAALRASRGNV
jgi:hypothetical protein